MGPRAAKRRGRRRKAGDAMKSEYYAWIAGIAFALAAFAVAIMAVGYQPLTFGRGATVVVLVIVGVVSLVLRRRGRN